jgi:predicted tellurium resistance membrane protein TerC
MKRAMRFTLELAKDLMSSLLILASAGFVILAITGLECILKLIHPMAAQYFAYTLMLLLSVFVLSVWINGAWRNSK